jgi:hypothetical protein
MPELERVHIKASNAVMMREMLQRFSVPPSCEYALYATDKCSDTIPVSATDIIPLGSDASKMFEATESLTLLAWSGDTTYGCGVMLAEEEDARICSSEQLCGNRLVRRSSEPPKMAPLLSEFSAFFSFPRLRSLSIQLLGHFYENGQGGQELTLCDAPHTRWRAVFEKLPTLTHLSISTRGAIPSGRHPLKGLETQLWGSQGLLLPNLRFLCVAGQIYQQDVRDIVALLRSREENGAPRLLLLRLTSDTALMNGWRSIVDGDAVENTLLDECASLVDGLKLS